MSRSGSGHRGRACVLWLAASGCSYTMALDPRGPGAAWLESLWWILFGVTLPPTAITLGVLLIALVRRRRSVVLEQRRQEHTFVLVAGFLIPGLIVVGLLIPTFLIGEKSTRAGRTASLTIDVVGHQFWWEVVYPEHGIVTANEIHVPTHRTVRLRLTSADVIHSVWVPQLQGKTDMIPGHVTEMWLEADEPGTYRGFCAEFCGIQHALMGFVVIATPPEQYQRWIETERILAQPPGDPALARGLAAFRERGCSACHSIRGVLPPALAPLTGPDLTHLASRRTLGAATLANNRGNLAGWIMDPQPIKPGARMPASNMLPDELHAMLDYLESLR